MIAALAVQGCTGVVDRKNLQPLTAKAYTLLVSCNTVYCCCHSLVAAPCMYLGCLKSCAVPHRGLMFVPFCSSRATSATRSRCLLVAARSAPSGAMSLSVSRHTQQNSTMITSMALIVDCHSGRAQSIALRSTVNRVQPSILVVSANCLHSTVMSAANQPKDSPLLPPTCHESTICLLPACS